MQNPAGHRLNIHNGDLKEAGIGVINGTNGGVGPQLVTQDLGYPRNVAFVTGVVFDDLNGNNLYDIGEGRSGVRVDVDQSAFYAISSTSGAYSVPVIDDGVYDVMFSGGGFASFATSASILNGLDVKIDYLVSALLRVTGDYDGGGEVGLNDLNLVLFNWNVDASLVPVTWVNERPDSGSQIGLPQLNGVLFNWGVATVPEPTRAVLCAQIVFVLFTCTRKQEPR